MTKGPPKAHGSLCDSRHIQRRARGVLAKRKVQELDRSVPKRILDPGRGHFPGVGDADGRKRPPGEVPDVIEHQHGFRMRAGVWGCYLLDEPWKTGKA